MVASLRGVVVGSLGVMLAMGAVSSWSVALGAEEPAAQGAPGAPVGAAATVAPEGAWDGAVELPGNMRLKFRVTFVRGADGSPGGTLDIPMQGLAGAPLRDVAQEGRVLKFTFGPGGMPVGAWAMFEATQDEAGKAASGQMMQHGQKFPLSMTRVAADAGAAALSRPQEPRPPFPYTERELSFVNGNDGTRLVGTLTIPGKPEGDLLVSGTRHPAVVLITGSGAQDRDESLFGHKPFAVLADHLARHGIASLRADDRGVGGSTGSLQEATGSDLAGDIRAAIAILRVQPDVDPTRIGLIGHSEGGMLAPMVAAEDPTVRFIVLLAGTGVTGAEILRLQTIAIFSQMGVPQADIDRQLVAHQRVLDLAAKDGVDRAELKQAIAELVKIQLATGLGGPQPATQQEIDAHAEAQLASILSPWFRSFVAYDPRPALRKLRCAVLAMNGSLDLQVPAKENLGQIAAALKEGGNENVTIVEVAGVNHLFQPATTGAPSEYAMIETTISPEVLAQISAWIRSKTGLPPEDAAGAAPAGAAGAAGAGK